MSLQKLTMMVRGQKRVQKSLCMFERNAQIRDEAFTSINAK
ncbi:hypothetical protein ACMXYR_08055 [Neptuniibacter sp. QD29_5]